MGPSTPLPCREHFFDNAYLFLRIGAAVGPRLVGTRCTARRRCRSCRRRMGRRRSIRRPRTTSATTLLLLQAVSLRQQGSDARQGVIQLEGLGQEFNRLGVIALPHGRRPQVATTLGLFTIDL